MTTRSLTPWTLRAAGLCHTHRVEAAVRIIAESKGKIEALLITFTDDLSEAIQTAEDHCILFTYAQNDGCTDCGIKP